LTDSYVLVVFSGAAVFQHQTRALTLAISEGSALAQNTVPERGVYAIQCIDGRSYVGSSFDVHTRWRKHREALRRGANVNRPLQEAWDALGADSFSFAVLEGVPVGDLFEAEQRWMDRFRERGAVFNVAPTAGSNTGLVAGTSTRAKMSATRTGKTASVATRARLSAAKAGSRHPCAKVSEADIPTIRNLAEAGMVQTAIAEIFGISRPLVSLIVSRKRWAHI
jgi:group I intron endonuclease